jgi:hypothetical protein
MSEQQANRMSFMFFWSKGKANKVCCCTLKTGSYIINIITLVLLCISLLSNKGNVSPVINYIVLAIRIIVQILFLVSVYKFNFSLSFIVWIIDTIFTYIFTVAVVILIILVAFYGGNVSAQGVSAGGVIIVTVIILLSALVLVLYLNYVIYSVSKTIGLNQRELLNGEESPTTVSDRNNNFI